MNPVNLGSFKTRVDYVHLDGVSRTKEDILNKFVRQLFEATNFEQVVVLAHGIRKQLESLGLFKEVNVYIDSSRGNKATKDGLEVTYKVIETRRLIGGINTMVGNSNDGSVVLQLKMPNTLGRGEVLQAEYQYGTKHTTGFNATFIKPIMPWLWPQPKLTTSVFQHGADAPWSGYREIDRGTFIDLSFKSSQFVQHSLRWEGIWREIGCLSNTTGFAVREEAGHTLKSSLKHILTWDKRDNWVLPNYGGMFRLQQEYAGVGGNVGFHKHQIDLQYNLPFIFYKDIILQGCFQAGIMKPSQLRDSVTSITDRFFLGGPLTLRGFQLNGVGPHSEGNALGARTFWNGGLHIYTPLPFKPGDGGFGDYFRTHLFVNAGNIGEFNFSDDYYKNLNLLMNRMRYSVGLGIVLSIGHIARFELNYCFPWGQLSGDKLSQGLQFGIGVNFT